MSALNVLNHNFVVRAPLAAVAAFHHDARVLPRLTPPPILVQLHRVDPLGEGSIADFTLWFGPLPVRWVALHSQVDPLRGFTDTQQSGPLKFWRHIHSFEAVDAATTRVSEHVEFEIGSTDGYWKLEAVTSALVASKRSDDWKDEAFWLE